MATPLEFVRRLSCNDTRARLRALKSLKRWLAARAATPTSLDDLELLKLWKGLYMCMWHADKPLVQEELAENIASMQHIIKQDDILLRFMAMFYRTMTREWHSIDRLRLDKFYMLLRQFLHESFVLLQGRAWEEGLLRRMCAVLEEGPLNPDLSQTCAGVQLHVAEIFLPELLATATEIPSGCSLALLGPHLRLLAKTHETTVVEVVSKTVFLALLRGRKAKKLNVDLRGVAGQLLGLAVRRDTLGRNRKTLYRLKQSMEEAAASMEEAEKEEESEKEEEEEVEMEEKEEEEVKEKDEDKVPPSLPAAKKRRAGVGAAKKKRRAGVGAAKKKRRAGVGATTNERTRKRIKH